MEKKLTGDEQAFEEFWTDKLEKTPQLAESVAMQISKLIFKQELVEAFKSGVKYARGLSEFESEIEQMNTLIQEIQDSSEEKRDKFLKSISESID